MSLITGKINMVRLCCSIKENRYMSASDSSRNTPATPDSKTAAELKQRITTLIEQIGAGLYEREEVIAMAFLAVISGQNTFLLGPPGTAKSLISRRLSSAFHQPVYFEHLMSRFTTPEEVFGPVSIKELKQDRYIRKTRGYLPQAEFAFLDEIWKSSPAILNTLLTLINEHIFQNGEHVETAPLKGLIAASNEVPAEGQGLDALYDRFVVRLYVPPVAETANFQALIQSRPSESDPGVEEGLSIHAEELAQWKNTIHEVVISDSCLQIIESIRQQLHDRFDDLGVYTSDRRWQRAVYVMKASAFFNGRSQTNHTDAVLLKHCLWTQPDNREAVAALVLKAISACGFADQTRLARLDEKKAELDEDITNSLYHREDVYHTVKLANEKEYLQCQATFKSRIDYGDGPKEFQCYIPFSKYKAQEPHHPVDATGNSLKEMEVIFDTSNSSASDTSDAANQVPESTDTASPADAPASCEISHEGFHDKYSYQPQIRFRKGSRKETINEARVKALLAETVEVRSALGAILSTVEEAFANYAACIDSPFVRDADTAIAAAGIKEQIDQIKLRIKDCERLESLCQQ